MTSLLTKQNKSVEASSLIWLLGTNKTYHSRNLVHWSVVAPKMRLPAGRVWISLIIAVRFLWGSSWWVQGFRWRRRAVWRRKLAAQQGMIIEAANNTWHVEDEIFVHGIIIPTSLLPLHSSCFHRLILSCIQLLLLLLLLLHHYPWGGRACCCSCFFGVTDQLLEPRTDLPVFQSLEIHNWL